MTPVSRTLIMALSVLLGMVAVLVAGDWLSRVGAQSLLARSVQEASGTFEEPQIAISGAFFLPQVIRGRYDRVDIDQVNVSSGPLRISSIRSELNGVHVSFHNLLVQKVDRIVIDHATEVALLTFDDLNSYLAQTGHRVTVQPTADGAVQITGTVSILGQSISASADAKVSSQDGAIALDPLRIHTDTSLDQASEVLLGQRFRLLIPLDPLPFGQVISSIEQQETGFLVHAGGTGVVINP